MRSEAGEGGLILPCPLSITKHIFSSGFWKTPSHLETKKQNKTKTPLTFPEPEREWGKNKKRGGGKFHTTLFCEFLLPCPHFRTRFSLLFCNSLSLHYACLLASFICLLSSPRFLSLITCVAVVAGFLCRKKKRERDISR